MSRFTTYGITKAAPLSTESALRVLHAFSHRGDDVFTSPSLRRIFIAVACALPVHVPSYAGHLVIPSAVAHDIKT